MRAAIVLFILILWGCSSGTVNEINVKKGEKESLPIISESEISDFSFVNQDGKTITKDSLNGKIYVADFFFTTCPTICPKMKSQMIRVYEQFKTTPNFKILSHTIDPEHDNVEVLKDFSDRLQVDSRIWYFVTGDKDSIYTMAERYMVSASEDPSAPGGFIHSGAFILMDSKCRIRGYYDGTKEQAVDSLIKDIKILMKE